MPQISIFQKINDPHPEIDFNSVLDGMMKFRNDLDNHYAFQMMFVGQNRSYIEEMSKLVEEIKPDQIQINTPSRANNPILSPRN